LGVEAAERIPAEFDWRHGLRWNEYDGELGNVAVAGDEPRNPPPSEPRAQAIDQAVEPGLIFARAEADLLVRAGLGIEHRAPRQIEAETRIDFIAQRCEPLDEERADRLRIAQRARGADRDSLDRAIGAKESKLESPCAVAARRQRRLEPCREPLDACEHVLLARDRLVKTFLREIGRDRQARGQRLVFTAERTIHLTQEIGTETGGERRARQIENIADAVPAEARQRGDCLLPEPPRCPRESRNALT